MALTEVAGSPCVPPWGPDRTPASR